MFSKECIAIRWDRSFRLYGLNLKLCSQGYTVQYVSEVASNAETLLDDIKSVYENLHASEDSITIFSPGEDFFAIKDLHLPKMKDDLLEQSLFLQAEQFFPFHISELLLGFRAVNDAGLYRCLASKKDKWAELLATASAAKFGVDAFLSSSAILDYAYKGQSVTLAGVEYHVSETGELANFGRSDESAVTLPMELKHDLISEEKLAEFLPAILLAHFGLSKGFPQVAKKLSPIPEALRPNRYERAKKMIAFQVCALILISIYFVYSLLSQRFDKANQFQTRFSELNTQMEDLGNYSEKIHFLERSEEQLRQYNDQSQVSLSEIVLELTELLPENYSIKNLLYDSKNSRVTVTVNMTNGQAAELTDAFQGSHIFNRYPVFNDSGNRLVLQLKSFTEED